MDPILVAAAAAALVLVLVVAFLVGRSGRRAAAVPVDARELLAALDQHRQELAAQAAQLEARLAQERAEAVSAAASMAASMAGEKLQDTMTGGTRLLDLRTSAFEKRVEGLGTQLERLGDLVARLQQEAAAQHGQLVAGIEHVASTGQRLAETTAQLREALASPKARGQWGERMADDVLRLAGMVEGVTHVKQTALPGGTVPDVTFLLPGGRRLHMDVKFPIDNYLRHLEATTAAERDATAKAFLRDVRARVKELRSRGYIDGDTTVDAVLLFIPNEGVWSFVHEHDPGLLDAALADKVVLCSPVSLFAVLAVIRQAVEQAQLTRTSDEILRCLTAFRAQWAKYAEAVDVVERRFASVHKAVEELAGPRRRMLERQLDRIDDLRQQRGLPPAPAGLGDGDGEALRRAAGDVRPLA